MFPASVCLPPSRVGDDWSAQARILPYLEQGDLYNEVDFDQGYAATPQIMSLRMPAYLCPSEVNDHVRKDSAGNPVHYPLNYAVNMGVWFVYNPNSNQGGNGAFTPNAFRGFESFTDGTSNTVCAAEVKAYAAYYRDSASVPGSIPVDASSLCGVGSFKSNSGHTEWVDGRVHQTGYTAVFTPNQAVHCADSGTTYEVDWTSYREGKAPGPPRGNATYAAVTSRSYHSGIVNAVLMDGSVQSITNDIQLDVWRAINTRNGGEAEGSGSL